MDIDQALRTIGETGSYQLLVYNLYCMLAISTAFHHFVQVFTGGKSDYWCAFDRDLNFTDHQNWRVPTPADDPKTFVNEHQCKQYSATYGENVTSVTPLIDCQNGYEFNHSKYASTLQEDFLLVCEDNVRMALAQSAYFAGVLVGSLLFGSLSDWIGRKRTIILCVTFEIAFGISTGFVGSYKIYVLFRFITATVIMGKTLANFTMVSELAGTKIRSYTGSGTAIYFAVGMMLMSLVAYFIRDWRNLQVAVSVPASLALLYLPFLPESPKWLLSQSSVSKAERTIRKLAKKNNAKLPSDPFLVSSNMGSNSNKRTHTVVDLFRHRKLRLYTLNIMSNWFVVVMVYYAITINTSGLGIDPYIAFMINGLLEIPAYIVTIALMDRFGRRRTFSILMMVSTVSCLATGFIRPGVTLVVVVMLGKFGITVAYSVLYFRTAEIFPTPVRSAGMGVSSMCGRIGSVISPFALLLSDWWQPLPVFIFSFLSFICGFLSLLLPETAGQKLPQTISAYRRTTEMRATTKSIDEGENAETVMSCSIDNSDLALAT